MIWRLWYADGLTVSSEECAPADVPGYGVIALAQPDPTPGTGNVGYLVMAGYDWYFWRLDTEEWAGVAGDASMWDLILHREPITGVCAGRLLPRARYEAILALAQVWAEDRGLPRKSALAPVERRR